METNNLNGRWDASLFFKHLCYTNRLAQSEDFTFCRVSGLEGFEEAVNQMQSVNNFICVSDIADGYTELNNTPRTRRIKTVFFAMRHGTEDMEARTECMEIMRELFRQFMSRLIIEKVQLEQNCIFIDPRITFNEIDRYFFSGCAGAYFQIAIDCYTDLRHNADEWTDEYNTDHNNYIIAYDVYLVGHDDEKIPGIKELKEVLNIGLAETKVIYESDLPYLLYNRLSPEDVKTIREKCNACQHLKFEIIEYWKKPTIS